MLLLSLVRKSRCDQSRLNLCDLQKNSLKKIINFPTMNRPQFLFFLLIPLLIICSCGHPEPVFVSFSDLCQKQYYDQWVITEGHLSLPEKSFHYDITSGRRGYIQLDLREGKYSPGYAGILLNIPSKGKENSAEPLPSRYSTKDLKVRSDTGAILLYNQRVRITGQLDFSQGKCYIRVEKIESI